MVAQVTLYPDFRRILADADKTAGWAPRLCLTCSRSFLSESTADRVCWQCKNPANPFEGTRH